MARRSWVVNPEPPYNLIPKEEYARPVKSTYHIMPDMPDFVSPIDKRVVRGRKGYREHCKRYEVTNTSDYTETWKQDAKKRERLFESQRKDRAESIARAFDQQGRKR